MLIMKFVYNFANMNDVDILYEKIQEAHLKIRECLFWTFFEISNSL